MHNASIIAPAGHGKTELISDLVNHTEGKQLILTHTNAGVEALKKRMLRKNISSKKFSIFTIAGFCLLWCQSFPKTAEINTDLSPFNKNETQAFYSQTYEGAKKIFINQWAQIIISNSYSGIIVDEYQDCLIEQHEIFLVLTNSLPLRVLGDPMQSIFQWAGELVDMYNLEFPNVIIKTKPWRWISSNPRLGQWISEMRDHLERNLKGECKPIDITDIPGSVKVIPPSDFIWGKFRYKYNIDNYKSIAYVVGLENQQLSFAKKTAGAFQYDEKQNMDELINYAEAFTNLNGKKLCLSLISFLQEGASHISSELKSYINNVNKNSFNFSQTTKHQSFGKLLIDLNLSPDLLLIRNAIDYILVNPKFNVYRKELFEEMIRSINLSKENKIDLSTAIANIRYHPHYQNRYTFYKRLSTRVILSKGLEFDCVIVDKSSINKPQDFYVAISRAKKMVFIISENRNIKY